MKRGIIFCLLVCPLCLMAQDSIALRGFWQRYSRSPRMVAPDTAWTNAEARRDAKRVRLVYNVDFDSYFDNREYKDKGSMPTDRVQMPQTIFSFRLSPTVGVRINDRVGGSHSLIAGVRYTQPLGGNWRDAKVIPTAYYHFQSKGVNLQLGAIPYENRILSMPDWLQYDSLVYARPNIQGALISYQDRRGFVEFMCDWRGSQSMERREMFRLLVDGQYQYKWFFVGGLAHLNHTAGSADPEIHAYESLYDDLNLGGHVGFDFTRMTSLDSLTVKATYICGIARDREREVEFHPQGVLVELYANWWFLGVKNTTYIGDNLQPLRWSDNGGSPIGALMCQGDPFYQATFYNRTDLFAYFYRSAYVNCYFSWNLHYDNVCRRLQNQQQLIVRFSLDGLYRQPDRNLRGLFDK
ncbi:MAG: hypothetical protein MJZ75_06275 [Paludibacteraceae bacterium]|nr:hypothetical protein [Paludibacteraceae bacterium]